MDTLERIKMLMDDMNIKKVAEKTDIQYTTLLSFTTGRTKTPTFEMINKLQKYFEARGER